MLSAPFGGFEEINCPQEGATLSQSYLDNRLWFPFITQPLWQWRAFVVMIRLYFSRQFRGRNGCSRVSDSTFCSPIRHLVAAALTRLMFPKSATLLFVFTAALWEIVTTAWFAFFFIPGLMSRCKIYICVCTKVNWFRTASEKQFVSNYWKSLASVKVHSITPFRWFPEFHITGPDLICQGSNALSVFIYSLLYFHRRLQIGNYIWTLMC